MAVAKSKVRLKFEPHPKDGIYDKAPPDPKVDLFVFEDGGGLPKDRLPQFKDRLRSGTFEKGGGFRSSAFKFLRVAMEGGAEVVPGEMTGSRAEQAKLSALDRRMGDELSNATFETHMWNIKDFFDAYSAFYTERHRLIRRTIRDGVAAGSKVEARYGDTHSILSKELTEDGIETERQMEPTLMGWNTSVLRRRMRGVGRDEIPEIDYKRGFVAFMTEAYLPTGWSIGAKSGQINAGTVKLASLVETTMIEKLPEPTLDNILETKDFAAITEESGFPLSIKGRTRPRAIEKWLDANAKDHPEGISARFWKHLSKENRKAILSG